jgi:cob(I)alamin adenosyltransferase
MKIYTKTGDDGTTGLFGGGRVHKSDLRIEAYGTVDELNACIGLVRSTSQGSSFDLLLEEIQKVLFVMGADLATPLDARTTYMIPRIEERDVFWLESEIDKHEETLPPLTKFILPGGSPAASFLHMARTVARRAERLVVALADIEEIGPFNIQFLNRLSDLLFVLARVANQSLGVSDVEWDGKRDN